MGQWGRVCGALFLPLCETPSCLHHRSFRPHSRRMFALLSREAHPATSHTSDWRCPLAPTPPVRAAVRRVCGHFLSARAKRLCQPTPRSLLLVLPRRTPKLTPEMLFARHLARCFGGALPRKGRTDPVSLLWRRLPVTVQNYFLFFFSPQGEGVDGSFAA